MNGVRALVTRMTLRIGLLLATSGACAVDEACAAEGAAESDVAVPGAEQAKPYKGEGLVVVPLAMYSPETHVGLGGLLVRFFRVGDSPVESRVSSFSVIALVTSRYQAIIELLPEIYWD